VGFFRAGEDSTSSAATIKNCYATGNVLVQGSSNVTTDLYTGGFAGSVQNKSSISDCYALGNVTVDKKNDGAATLNTGGLIGHMQVESNTYVVERCFTTGSVESSINTTTQTDRFVRIGGILGNKYTSGTNSPGILRKCVALGPRVTLKGNAANRYWARVCGFAVTASPSETPVGVYNNYAISTMQKQNTSTYSGTASSAAGTSKIDGTDGLNVDVNQIRTTSFWLDTAGLAFNYDTSAGGMGIVNTWDFSTLPFKGHPLLVGVGGQQ